MAPHIGVDVEPSTTAWERAGVGCCRDRYQRSCGRNMEQRLTFFTRVRVDVYGEAAWTVTGLATRIADVAPVVPVL